MAGQISWAPVTFGKHKGMTLPQLIFADPDYFFWALSEGAFDKSPILKSQAQMIDGRARRIRIPNNQHGHKVVQYVIHPEVGKFDHFEIISSDQPAHQGGSAVIRKPFLDLSLPRNIAAYDKQGGRQMVEQLKELFFGSRSSRMTKQRAESFFNNSENFE